MARTLIFIVAYNAERHIESVLERIPAPLLDDPQVEFLIIDDASRDLTPAVAARWAHERGVRTLSVLQNPVNQGYGGNQKLGYRYAIDAGFDHVVLLHGDGQYAPEMLPQILAALAERDLDVLLCSRMHSLSSARKGGMPLYKIVGNRLLTIFQNTLTGRNLSEYHTGYRAYSTRFLKRVPFEINTNEFHFDTEILLQAFRVDARVGEIPAPTHYGDETCHVDGVRYAKDVVMATIQYACHRLGFMCSLKYRSLGPADYVDKTHVPGSTHAVALELVRKLGPARVLDLGCGPGFVAAALERDGMQVTALDAYEPVAALQDHRQFDLEAGQLPVDPFEYDVITMLDVIEHLAQPEDFLLRLRNESASKAALGKAPWLVISTPNVAFATMRLGMLLGRFTYGERGILDLTHKRLFTRDSFIEMLRDCSFEVERVLPIGVPFGAVMPGRMGRFLNWFSGRLARLWPTMFAFQFMLVCRPRPGARQLLSHAIRHVAPPELPAFGEART